MNTVSASFRSKLRLPLSPAIFRFFSTSPPDTKDAYHHYQQPLLGRSSNTARVRVVAAASVAQLKENWLRSISCPFPLEEEEDDDDVRLPQSDVGGGVELGTDSGSEWVVGVDPDVSGALALLKGDGPGCSAQVFDAPHVKVMVGKTVRRRLDARSIIQLLHSIGAPLGTKAYIEQSTPFPKDGKQGWWSGGYTYGLWIGILVASGFSVVPVSSRIWKYHFELSRNLSSKDDSREAASLLFPSLSSLLRRKKDHGRAEALLIAAYGKSQREKLESACS